MRAASCFVVTGLAAFAPAQAKVVDVGAGPLLTFTVEHGGPDHRESAHFVVEVEGAGPAREFWRTGHNTGVLRRLDRHRLLAASYGDPHALVVIDLAAGTVRELAPGAPHGFIAVHGDDVLYLGDPRARGSEVPDNYLYAAPWRGGERRRLCEALFDRVPVVEGNLAVAVSPEDREVWVASIVRAEGRRLWTAPEGATSLRVALSPAGQRLAIGCVGSDGQGQLRVVDVGTGGAVASWDGLPIHVNAASSSTPVLEVGWDGDEHVVCSETRGDRLGMSGNFVFVARKLASGEVAGETAYAPIGLWHTPPSRAHQPAPPPPQFTATDEGVAARVLRRTGSTIPLATIAYKQHGDITFASDGRFATARTFVDGSWRILLFRSDSDEPRELATAWSHSFVWLPAAN